MMQPDLSIYQNIRKPTMPNFLATLQDGETLRKMRAERKLRTREEKFKDRLGGLYRETGGDVRKIAGLVGPEFPEKALELNQFADLQEEKRQQQMIEREQEQRARLQAQRQSLEFGSNVATNYLSLDEEQKKANIGPLRGVLAKAGLTDLMNKTEYDQEVEGYLQTLAQAKESSNSSKFGLNPIYGMGTDRKPVAMRMEESGLKALSLPENVTELTPGYQKIDLGNQWGILNMAGEVVGYQPKGVPTEKTPEYRQSVVEAEQKGRGEVSETEKRREGQDRLTETILNMKSLFEDLRKLPGGIIDIEKGPISNFGARLASSGIGQSLQQAVGGKAQSIRNSINLIKPTLINHVRQATAMGAKGMDSERELEFYLSAVGNEKLDFQSNMLAIKLLDDNFGVMGREKFSLPKMDINYEDINPEFKGLSRDELKRILLKDGPVKQPKTKVGGSPKIENLRKKYGY